MYIVYEVAGLCYIPSRQCFEEMRFFKEVQFSFQCIHFNQKVVVIYKLVVAFELVIFFSGRNLFVKVGFFKEQYVLSTMCIVF